MFRPDVRFLECKKKEVSQNTKKLLETSVGLVAQHKSDRPVVQTAQIFNGSTHEPQSQIGAWFETKDGKIRVFTTVNFRLLFFYTVKVED